MVALSRRGMVGGGSTAVELKMERDDGQLNN